MAGSGTRGSGDKSRGEGRAHWGNLGTTQLKELELINLSQLITAQQSGLPLLTCCSAPGVLREPITEHCSPALLGGGVLGLGQREPGTPGRMRV